MTLLQWPLKHLQSVSLMLKAKAMISRQLKAAFSVADVELLHVIYPLKSLNAPPPNPAWTRGACWWICRPMGDWGHIIIVLKRSSSPRGRTRRCRTVAMQRAQVEFLLAAVVCQHHRTHSECGSCLEDVCAFQHVGHIRSSDSNREAVWSLKVTLVWL